MSKIGHVLVVPEPVIVVCNGCMIHNRKLLYVSSILKPKKNPKIQKSNLAHFGLKSNKPIIVYYPRRATIKLLTFFGGATNQDVLLLTTLRYLLPRYGLLVQ